ncbi:MAG: hypothetical protein IJ636_02615 [Bacteroidales bacterium]|nr:hypothetical protein [Bacteroidales bacterium]
MNSLIAVIALLLLLSFLLKASFLPRIWALASALLMGVVVWLAIPWLTRQSPNDVASWTAEPERLQDIAVCIVLEALLMGTFCFTRPAGRWKALRFYPGLLAFPAVCWIWAQGLFSSPGLDFGRFGLVAALVTLAVAGGGGQLLRRLLPDEELRVEGLFLVNLFLILLTVAATGAITF